MTWERTHEIEIIDHIEKILVAKIFWFWITMDFPGFCGRL